MIGGVDDFRVVQLSDTHLSERHPVFIPNFRAAGRMIAALGPDLVVNTGDITFDGANVEADLAFARACHAAIGVSVRAIPGNHDLGDNPWQPAMGSAISEERLARYRRHFGDDCWSCDAGEWTLIGLNAQLFGSGLAAEGEQWEFLATAAASARRRPVALFIHKPLFRERADELDVGHRYVPPDHRRRLLDLLGGARLGLVASGHVHQHRRRRVDGVEHCWGPSTAFVFPDARQPRLGTKRVGYVEYAFGPNRVDVRIVEPPELANHELSVAPDADPH